MKLVTYRTDAHGRAGILIEDTILDLAACLGWYEHREGRRCRESDVEYKYGKGVLGFVENESIARPAADEVLIAVSTDTLPKSFDGRTLAMPARDKHLLSPIPRPPSMRDGYAFRQHVETARRNRGVEMIPEFDLFPVFYFTNHQSVIGPGDLEVEALHLNKLDFELEAAVVIGRGGKNLDIAGADRAIFGLMVMNDFSARVLQMEEMKLSLGPAKGKDFATGLGPWLVTLDELAPHTHKTPTGAVFDLAMKARVNGVEVSSANVKDMTWTFAQILERASYGVTLHPGDVIGSGTCGTGCFLELNGSQITHNQWLQIGDVVELEIEGLGALRNRVVSGS
jgi:fumarylacetoacetate (FAA) hydrolase